jgi:hypothetical protein
MRVNLIGNFKPNTGLQQDAKILRGLLALVYEDVQIRNVRHISPECTEADLNIFIEVMNPALLQFAGKNIWIPNPEWTYKTWEPYLKMMDEIWVKTHEAEVIFAEYNPIYIGWTSIDKELKSKDYNKAICLVGKNIYRHPKPILRAYYEIMNNNPNLYKRLPHLYIPYNPEHIKLFAPHISKVTLLDKELPEEEYDVLLQECGLAVCLSASEGYGHAVNEAMSTGSNLILSPIKPFFELTKHATVGDVLTTVDHPSCMGVLVDTTTLSIIEALEFYVNTDLKQKKKLSEKIRLEYETRHTAFIDRMKSMFNWSTYTMKDKFIPEADLPDVSIITITKDRRVFMPLAKYSYLIQSYPEDKLEWVIVDDGEDSIEDTLIGIPNVKYVRCSNMTIGQKRNLGVESAMYDTLVMLDDDDVYPNNSILHRVAFMNMSPSKECAFCTTLPCYDICKYSSFVNVPPITLPMAQRLSEATLCFTRKFWSERKFSDIQIAEGETFIQGREQACREISPQEVIVSLVHSKNTSSRRIPEIADPNGCHFGFKEELFALVSEIGEKLKELSEETLLATAV